MRLSRKSALIDTETGSGWEKKAGFSQTPDYDEAECKININTGLFAGKLKITGK